MIQFIFQNQSMWARLLVAFIENFLCDIPLMFVFKYSLQVAIIVRSRSSFALGLDLDDPNLA
jgi:hypothetical protein